MIQDASNIQIYDPTGAVMKADMMRSLSLLAKEADEIMLLNITDRKSRLVVHDKHIELRDKHIEITKGRKAFTEEADQRKKIALATEKELIGVISVQEEALKAKKEAYDSEQELIKQKELNRKAVLLGERMDILQKFAVYFYPPEMIDMTEEEFLSMVAIARSNFLVKEQLRIEEEKAAEDARVKKEQEAEDARVKKEQEDAIKKEEMDKRQTELDARQKIIDDQECAIRDQQDVIDQENKRIAYQKELDAVREVASAKARIEEANRIQREADEKKQLEKTEQEVMEKKRKYKTWLESSGYVDDGSFKPLKTDDGKKVILWKKVSEFII